MTSFDQPGPEPPSVTIHRTSPDDEGSRQILIAIDGQHVGQLLYGQTLSRTVTPGAHKVTANNTLVWKTLPFEAEPGSHVQFTVWNRLWGGSLMQMFFVFFGAAPLALSIAPGPPPEPAKGPPAADAP